MINEALQKAEYVVVAACVCAQSLGHVQLFGAPWTKPTRLPCEWILQARILEWVVISDSRGSSGPRDQTRISCISGTGR